MASTEERTREASPEEEDILQRSTKRTKESHESTDTNNGKGKNPDPDLAGRERSYRDTVMGDSMESQASQEEEDEEGNTSDDDEILEGDKISWFGMGMTKQEKIAARRPWRNSLIIKLVGRSIGYHYLLRRIQAMWRTQTEPTLIDVSNNFYVVKLQGREEYERALFDGPWMIGDHYLHVQKWRPNFRADKAEIDTMPVWVRFPILPLEYYTERWLRIAGNHVGKTIKVDIAALLASRGRFGCVCVEIDLRKPLMAGYVMRREYYRLQYEGLQDLCFGCGRYGHRQADCPENLPKDASTSGKDAAKEPVKMGEQQSETSTEKEGPRYGEWTTVQRNRRRPSETVKGKKGNRSEDQIQAKPTGDHTKSHRHEPQDPKDRVAANRGQLDASTSGDLERNNHQSGSHGSRFANMANLDEEEGEKETVAMETNDCEINGMTAGIAPTLAAGNAKGKKVDNNNKNMQEDDVVIAVSHPSIVEGMKRPVGPAQGRAGETLTMSQRLMKDKALKDITNKLETRGVSMKPTRSGLRNSNGVVIREVGPTSTWTLGNGKPNSMANGLNALKKDTVEIGHHSSRPPDPTRDPPFKKQSPVLPMSIPEGSRAQDSNGADEAAAESVASAEMEGVEMASGIAGTPST